jgi:tRNA U34 5-carboxymethylaminomethyl modifying GTPase MnmE/TrmE
MSTLYNNKYDILASTIQPNPASVKYWADLSSNPNGGDLKYFNGTKWVLVNNKYTEDISQIKQQIADLEQNKEDKVEGKGLSTEDYTTQEKNKLASLQNYNDSEVRELISALNLRLTTLSEDLESLEARVAALETSAA